MDLLKIKDWDRFQHYKDRNPPWIKLHASFLTSKAWLCSTAEDRNLAIACMLVAAQNGTDGTFEPDHDYFKSLLTLDHYPNFKSLIDNNFLEDASKCYHGASKCYNREEERREEKEKRREDSLSSTPVDNPPKQDNCPYQKIINLYHEMLPELPVVKILTDQRKRSIKARWKSDIDCLPLWKEYFNIISQSDFLCGRLGTVNERTWVANLDWLLKPSNFAKVLERRYVDE